MRTNSLNLMLSILVSLFLLNGCSSKKYADAEKTRNDYINIMDEYITALDESDDAEDVAKAMNRFCDKMEVLMPRMERMVEKYPDLKDTQNLPEELKESQKGIEALKEKMISSMLTSLKTYMGDPEVQKALGRVGAVGRNYGNFKIDLAN